MQANSSIIWPVSTTKVAKVYNVCGSHKGMYFYLKSSCFLLNSMSFCLVIVAPNVGGGCKGEAILDLPHMYLLTFVLSLILFHSGQFKS